MDAICGTGNLIILHAGRCGSVVLSNALTQHPAVAIEGEVFAPGTLKGFCAHYGISDPIEILGKRINYMRHRRPQSQFYGFRTQLTQIAALGLDLESYLDQLEHLGFKYLIALKRKNFLRRIVSSIVGHHTSRWHQEDEDVTQITKILLDVDRVRFRGTVKPLMSHLRDEETQYRVLVDLSGSREVLQLIYEDDVLENPATGYRRICEYLQIEPVEVSIRYGRTNPFKLSEVIINFDDVLKQLHGSSFEWMMNE